VATAAFLLALAAQAAPDRTGVLVPLYTEPGKAWDTLAEARKAHPAVPIAAVVNVHNGPGRRKAGSYEAGIRALRDSGVRVLGYVATGYAKRAPDEVRADVDRWRSWYALEGVFFDEVADRAATVERYRDFDRHARAQGVTLVIGNPGTEVPEACAGLFDALVVYEKAGAPAADALARAARHGRARSAFLAYGVAALDAAAVREAAKLVSWLYLTGDALPNPWDTVSSSRRRRRARPSSGSWWGSRSRRSSRPRSC
jgi:hypothetical protein